jgi:hypothetical protein
MVPRPFVEQNQLVLARLVLISAKKIRVPAKGQLLKAA